MKICILTIATNKYLRFVDELHAGIKEKFCTGSDISFLLFTNHRDLIVSSNTRINFIEHEGWPMPTLKRYNFFVRERDFILAHDFCFYFDADMRVDGLVSEEVLVDGIVAARHPYQSFNNIKDITYDRNPKSLAYVPHGEGKTYYAGGFNGGKSESFVSMAEVIAERVEKDLVRGIIALWHDESHLNRYLLDNPPSLELSPSYCFPEEWYGAGYPYEPKIVALHKNHNQIRS